MIREHSVRGKLLDAQNGSIVIDAFGRAPKVVGLNTNVEAMDARLADAGQKIKVESSTLEAAGLLTGSKADTSAQKKSKGRKNSTSGSTPAAGQATNDQASGDATVSISADELAQLVGFEIELAERLKRTKSQE